MIGNVLIIVFFTAAFMGSIRLTWVEACKITEERTRRNVRLTIRNYAQVQRHWYRSAHDLEKVWIRKTEFEAKMKGLTEASKLI